MTSSPRDLGALLDRWVETGQARLLEAPESVTVTALEPGSVAELHAAISALGWPSEILDAAHQLADVSDLEEDMGPFVLTFRKPVEGADRRLLTGVGFRDALSGDTNGIWQLAFADVAFSTGAASFHPWGRADLFAPAVETKSPLDLVREGGEARLVPADIRKWLVRGEVTFLQWKDTAFQVFAHASAPQLIRSLASEVVGPEAVVFNGPPRLNLTLPATMMDDLGYLGYAALQTSSAWVYEDPTSAEQRHALFASEVARSFTREEPIGSAFAKAGKDVLEGARFAFQLGQSDLSREAIKTQGDLRRAIADDTTKAAEGTRSVAGAIAVAVVTGVGLVAARSTTTAEPWVLSVVAFIVGLYLLAVSVSGWMHLRLQRKLREQWRRRFYRFVSAEDYKAMVTEPARESELPYHIVGTIALVVSLGLFCLSVGQLYSRVPAFSAAPAIVGSDVKKVPG